jgi:peptidoglycan/xylan/chitin deacetylase (PgdA/CDA1 family)
VPFTIYLPTAFPDGLGEAWWLALEEMIARENRISLVIDRKERRFGTQSTAEKYDVYEFLSSWMRTLTPPDLSFAINVLCKRYSVDLVALSRGMSMDWNDLARLAADPLVTIGSATVNHPVLSNLKEADAQREMTMGKAVAEAAFRRNVRHFAYPFGDPAVRRWGSVIAHEVGFARRSTIPGVVDRDTAEPHAPPASPGWTAAFAADGARDPVRNDACRCGRPGITGLQPSDPAATSS